MYGRLFHPKTKRLQPFRSGKVMGNMLLVVHVDEARVGLMSVVI